MELQIRTPRRSLSRDWTIAIGDHTFDYCVRSGGRAWSDLLPRLAALQVDHFVMIADTGVREKAEEACRRIAALPGSTCTLFLLPVNEATKSIATIEQLSLRAEHEVGITVNSCIIGFGGGLVANIAGFLAAIQFRGLRLIQMPTTLLSMADVMPSVKQGVNTSAGKNHLGTYTAPLFVWADLTSLRTLPRIEIQSALCEMMKFILTIAPPHGSTLYETIIAELHPDMRYQEDQLLRIIHLCVEAKCQILAGDPHEQGEGLLFEYGHTVGHALELLSSQGPDPLPHGLAIGLGMLVAARVARMLGLLSEREEKTHHGFLHLIGVPTRIPATLSTDAILALLRHDNKRGRLKALPDDEIAMVLLRHLHEPHRTEKTVLTRVPLTVVRAAIEATRLDVFA
ncbi:3-dehydroquinate synthase family protein [Dictyobacter arantiisoli]|uniref:3-dehydroquinate synthase n=1 Tax=Dictyobacter arantiisoli TaxID=2014874 RepID=A0A5A5TIK4_9CHLR|nr:hypothetical protein [Dictyobacter arantiisoli]GCF11237.1 3-dehydroquinate synthase [Dictyobacter arantiisoli]